MLRESSRCGSCGTLPDEWLTPDGKRPRIPPPYEVHTRICYGCVESARAEKHLVPKDSKGVHVIFRHADPREYDADLWTE